jgi:uncharacterized protein (DUF433 family)
MDSNILPTETLEINLEEFITNSSRDKRLSVSPDFVGNDNRKLLDEVLKTTSSVTISTTTTISTEPSFKEKAMQLIDQLTEKYPLITMDEKVLGEPRLTDTRFAVSNVLTALTLYNSFDEVIEEYEGRYTEKQLKDAVKFARDLLDSFYRS